MALGLRAAAVRRAWTLALVTAVLGLLTAVPVSAAGTGAVEGRVLGNDGSPLRDICVYTSTATGSVKAVTDAAGHYRIEGLWAGRYRMQAVDCPDRGYLDGQAGPHPGTYYPVEEGQTVRADDITLVRPSRLSGRVTYVDGSPAQGVVLQLSAKRAVTAGVPTAYVDAAGDYAFEGLYPGEYTLSRFGNSHNQVRPGFYGEETSSTPTVITVEPETSASGYDMTAHRTVVGGQVFDADGEPAPGVCVKLGVDWTGYPAITGSDGRWSMGGIPTGDYPIYYYSACMGSPYDSKRYERQYHGGSFDAASAQQFPVRDDVPLALGPFEAMPAGGVRLRVVDRFGEPVTTCEPIVSGSYGGYATPLGGNVYAGQSGAGSSVVRAYCRDRPQTFYPEQGHPSDAVPVQTAPGEWKDLDLVALDFATVSGRVMKDGQPISACVLALYDVPHGTSPAVAGNVCTDAAGVYRFPNLPPSTYRFSARNPDLAYSRYHPNATSPDWATVVTVGNGAAVSGIDIGATGSTATPSPSPSPASSASPSPSASPAPSASPSAPASAGSPSPMTSAPPSGPSGASSPSPTATLEPSPVPSPAPDDAGTVPKARATDDSCPPGHVPEDGFSDVPAGSPHEASVDCVVWWQVAGGTGPGRYEPGAHVTRAQMATFLANAIRRSGGALPAPRADYFPDDAGSPHERNINALREAGIVAGRADGSYGAGLPVRRDAMATFLVQAYQYRAPRLLASGGDYFADDNGNAHEANIDRAAGAGFTGGASSGDYAPAVDVRRDQMASFLARVLDLLVEEGAATP